MPQRRGHQGLATVLTGIKEAHVKRPAKTRVRRASCVTCPAAFVKNIRDEQQEGRVRIAGLLRLLTADAGNIVQAQGVAIFVGGHHHFFGRVGRAFFGFDHQIIGAVIERLVALDRFVPLAVEGPVRCLHAGTITIFMALWHLQALNGKYAVTEGIKLQHNRADWDVAVGRVYQ